MAALSRQIEEPGNCSAELCQRRLSGSVVFDYFGFQVEDDFFGNIFGLVAYPFQLTYNG